MDSHSVASTENLVNYRTLCVKAGNPAPPSDYTVWCTPVTEAEYNRLASPNSRDPVYEIGYLSGDLRGEKYDKVNLFLERSTCLSYITFLVSEGIVSASTRYVLLEIPVKNVRLFDHVAGHKSTSHTTRITLWHELSRVFFGGNGPIHWRTTCAQAYAGVIFCGRVPTRAYAGGLLSRNAFANALAFWKRGLPHLHGHIFPSLAHLPLHGRIFPLIFPFIGTSSPSLAPLPFRQVGGGVGWAWLASARAFARLPPGYARDPERKTPNQIHGALACAKLPQICLRRLLARRLS